VPVAEWSLEMSWELGYCSNSQSSREIRGSGGHVIMTQRRFFANPFVKSAEQLGPTPVHLQSPTP